VVFIVPVAACGGCGGCCCLQDGTDDRTFHALSKPFFNTCYMTYISWLQHANLCLRLLLPAGQR
jgi:hypothetical protein